MKVETAQLHAIAAAAYVDETLVGLDPFSIITIFTTVLPIIQQLFGMCGRGDDPARFIARNPAVAQSQTRHECRKAARQHGTKVGTSQAGELARGLLEYVSEADAADVAAAMAE